MSWLWSVFWRSWLKRIWWDKLFKLPRTLCLTTSWSSVADSQKFGLQGNTIQDICEFDVWLKKRHLVIWCLPCLVRQLPSQQCPSNPKRPSQQRPSNPKLPRQHRPNQPRRPQLPSLVRSHQLRPQRPYLQMRSLNFHLRKRKPMQVFWSKYKPPSSAYSPTSPASTPVASPAEPSPKASAGTIVTPECKKRLELTPEGLDVFQLHPFLVVHLYVYAFVNVYVYMCMCMRICFWCTCV